MKYLRASVILMSVLCTYEALAQNTAERTLGETIATQLLGFSDQPLDVLLLFDSSRSVKLKGFNEGKSGSKNAITIIDSYNPISSYGSRVGLIEFSAPRRTGVRFRFGRHNRLRSVKKAIDDLRYDRGSSTATAKALKLALREFQEYGSRNKKLVWMFTDGKSNAGGSPDFPALQLKLTGATVCVAAIGSSVNMEEINSIASPGCVHTFSSFSEYDRVMRFAAAQASKNH